MAQAAGYNSSMTSLPMSYVVVDVETTGLSPALGDRVLEIGALRVVRGVVVGTFSQLVNPQAPIHPTAQAVHGIRPADVVHAPRMADILPRFVTFTAGLPLVAHNAGFDRQFLEAECRYCEFLDPFGDYYCTLQLSRWINPQLPHHDLDSLIRHYGIPAFQRHRALGDVQATQQLYEILRAAYERKSRPMESGLPSADPSTPVHASDALPMI